MSTAKKIIFGLIGLGLLAALGFVVLRPASQSFGATAVNHLEQGVWWFSAAHYFGSSQQMSIDASGNVTTTGTINGSTFTTTSMTVNGVTTYLSRTSAMTAATTTPCVVASPAATTTLESYAANFTVSSTTASLVVVATSTTAYATSSLVTSKAFGANTQGTVDWHPTALNSLVSPSTYIVMSMQGGIGTFSPTGTCNAVFRSVN